MARVFDGSDSNYLSITNPLGGLDISGTPMTVSAWVFPTTLPTNGRIAGKDSQTAVTPRGWNLHTSAGNLFRFEILDASGGGYNLTTAASTGVWAHVCGVHNSGVRNSLYKNGAEAAFNTNSRTLADTAFDFTIGRNPSVATSAFNGRIAEVAIWASALTATQVAALARGANPLMFNKSTLRAYYPLYSGAAANEPDLSGGQQLLTEVGTVAGGNHAPVMPLMEVV